ncbi:MAG: tetratricopeptide repeat protein [bacterium]
MKKSTRTIVSITLLLALSLFSCTKRSRYDELSDRIIVLFQQGQYPEAEKLAKEAVTIAKETFGPNHAKTAASLDTLAMIFCSQRNYEQAEPLYKETLAIMEKVSGPESPDLAHVLENMAGFYRTVGNEEEAERLTARLNKIRSNH